MSHITAIAYCVTHGALVETPDSYIQVTDSMKAREHYWTGSQRHNKTHFKREDGLLFQPLGLVGTWRSFPSSVHLTLYKNGSLTAFTSTSDRNCLCILDDIATLKHLIGHSYFLYTACVILAVTCLICFTSVVIKRMRIWFTWIIRGVLLSNFYCLLDSWHMPHFPDTISFVVQCLSQIELKVIYIPDLIRHIFADGTCRIVGGFGHVFDTDKVFVLGQWGREELNLNWVDDFNVLSCCFTVGWSVEFSKNFAEKVTP